MKDYEKKMGIIRTGDLIWYEKRCGDMKDFIKKKMDIRRTGVWTYKWEIWFDREKKAMIWKIMKKRWILDEREIRQKKMGVCQTGE